MTVAHTLIYLSIHCFVMTEKVILSLDEQDMITSKKNFNIVEDFKAQCFPLICLTGEIIWVPKEALNRSQTLSTWVKNRDIFKDKAYPIYCSYTNLQLFGEYICGTNDKHITTNTTIANLCDILLVDYDLKEAQIKAEMNCDAEKNELIKMLIEEAKSGVWTFYDEHGSKIISDKKILEYLDKYLTKLNLKTTVSVASSIIYYHLDFPELSHMNFPCQVCKTNGHYILYS